MDAHIEWMAQGRYITSLDNGSTEGLCIHSHETAKGTSPAPLCLATEVMYNSGILGCPRREWCRWCHMLHRYWGGYTYKWRRSVFISTQIEELMYLPYRRPFPEFQYLHILVGIMYHRCISDPTKKVGYTRRQVATKKLSCQCIKGTYGDTDIHVHATGPDEEAHTLCYHRVQ